MTQKNTNTNICFTNVPFMLLYSGRISHIEILNKNTDSVRWRIICTKYHAGHFELVYGNMEGGNRGGGARGGWIVIYHIQYLHI